MARSQTELPLLGVLVVDKGRAMAPAAPARARRVKETPAAQAGIYLVMAADLAAAAVLEELVEAPIALEEAVEDLGPFLQ